MALCSPYITLPNHSWRIVPTSRSSQYNSHGDCRKREGVLQPSQQVQVHLPAGAVSDCLSQNSQAHALILCEFAASHSVNPAMLSASSCKVMRVPLIGMLSCKHGQLLHITAGQRVIPLVYVLCRRAVHVAWPQTDHTKA